MIAVDADFVLLTLALVWPLVLVLAFISPQLRYWTLRLLPVAALPALLCSFQSPSVTDYSLDWLLLGVSFGIDETSSVFLLFTSLLWMAGGLLVNEQTRPSLAPWYLLTMTGSIAVLLARDIPTFFFAYALMSLATFGLIFDAGWEDSKRAARIYLLFAIIGEMVLLTALIMVAQNAGTLDIEHIIERTPDNLLMALLLIGFGIKSGVPLLHMALPPVYAALPGAAAVPLAGGLLHLGLYGWLRFLPFEYPMPMTTWGQVFVACGLLAIGYASVVGLLQKNPRALLAYSSISQMGLMILMVGVMLLLEQQRDMIMGAILLFAMHHALAKGALFYGLEMRAHSRLGLWLPALSLAGLPFTSGALAKAQVKNLTTTGLSTDWVAMMITLLPLASIGTTLLMARFLYLSHGWHGQAGRFAHAWWGILLLPSLLLPWLWPFSLTATVDPWAASWPVVLGSMIAMAALAGRKAFSNVPAVPPGDVLVVLEKIPGPWVHHSDYHTHHQAELDSILHPRPGPLWLANLESAFNRWVVAVSLLLIIILVMILLL